MTTDAPAPAGPAADEEYEFPVSDAQSRLLVLDQLNPGTAQYNVPAAFAVTGPFDVAAFGRALDTLVARHEALRTVFRTAPDGTQTQRVRAAAAATLTVREAVPADRADTLLRREAARPFDPAAGPLLRCTVYAVDDGTHRVLLVAHHLVCDGWSLGVVLDELGAAYRDEAAGRPHSPPGEPLQFPDYAVWRRERRAAGEYDTAVRHWVETLRGAPATLELPTDRPRPAVRSTAGGSARFPIPATVRTRLAETAAACGATPFMALFAAYAAFLARLSGRDDLVIGYPVSGREHPDLQHTVGMLAGTLALRVDVAGDPSFHELTGRVRDALRAAAPHQDAPFEAVVDALAPAREAGHDPVVQVVFSYDDDTALTLDLAGAGTRRLEVDLDTAKFDFHLHVERWGEDLAAQFIHHGDLYEAQTVRRWTRNFTVLLDGLLTDPHAPLSRLTPVAEDELRLLVAQNDRLGAAAPADRLVPDLIAEVAAARPDATALVHGTERLSYRRLLEGADALAARLRAAGVGPGSRVGLLLPRSADQGIAALAVLRAGGAYVPLDRAHPGDRLRYMLDCSGTGLLLTAEATAGQGAGLGVPCLRVDRTGPAEPPPVTDGPAPGAHDLAYVLFTSGSTGRPKGVAVEHRSLVNLTTAVRHHFPVTAADRVLQFVAFGFDVAVSDLFFPWVAGAELHVPTEDERLGESLLHRLRDSRITYVFLPPSAAMLLPDIKGQLPDLRTVAVGGEACPAELVERLHEPGRRIVNAYGPSEVSVYSHTADLTPGEPVVLGHAVAGSRCYVLDERLRPVPVGVPGEIYITGAGLARGYIERPGLTAERFVADPYGAPGTRMYRSGDLGRVDAHGVLTYLGRSDLQVKLRGVRIELGEIESLLAAHPDVRIAAAAVRGTGEEQRLAAYVVCRDGAAPPDDGTLRAHLAERLPAFMVPEVFVRLAELPLNGNGKIDRSRLPEPEVTRRAPDASGTATGTATERLVAEIWARVLTMDRVGVHDNFFDLGGNSVRLMRVLAGLREAAADGGLTLVDLFRHPTVTSLAARLDQARAADPAGPADPADPADSAARGRERHNRRTDARRLRSRKGTHR
ncbi:amino acid adenylation domain-containing protein [Streptomyces sp. SID486]|uniref:non-ribosomal peptide synthetase n=1 Tax=Streptomyces sp. SID486 TaxID=2690264 RepID=UPI00136DB56F|nr:non-ribosomal peptide synthetase [Streptomyces sp. SID486]MYX95115.1 amino acid adenylation domain-containing protein [Streptomyces sp. SID486]